MSGYATIPQGGKNERRTQPHLELFGYSRLKGISDIRTSFRTTGQPVFFVGPTAFSLPSIDRWARNFGDVACCDSRDSGHAAGVRSGEPALRRILEQRYLSFFSLPISRKELAFS